MSQAALLLPPIDATLEIETFAFDYGRILQVSRETIVSVVSISCSVSTVSTVTDPSPSSRIVGTPTIVPSPTVAGLPASAVLQQFGRMLANVTYLLQCVVLTSGGNQLSVWADLPCVQPG